ncbi:LacI family transcriptional regulator [Halobacillus salinarum]|uniref:LacI family transcriptional regulator n=1 Tax=Halobacillus salinarum TaxID=2932257 RepID=A0ABY4EK30_9BACI|nr:LacI family DNA-binding transcriptional regulator [Halobacillus salinarum]UOQ44827.1 LacI family transcriptional regulator [Halobacillus salinarum]
MATIKDVAKQAGVSVSVVSKALNDYEDINDKTKKRILKIAEELNYTPNLAGRNLSSKKRMTIGLISSAVFNTNKKDTNAYEVIKGIYTGVDEEQLELAIFLMDSQKQKQKSYTQFCRERNIGGAILHGLRTDDPYFKELLDTNIPCVNIDFRTDSQAENVGSVAIDNKTAGEEMADHLLTRGHRDIAIMAGTEETFVNIERLQGVKQGFEKHNVDFPESAVLYADFSEEKAYELAKDYLAEHRPTAFLCFSDLMVYGVMKAVTEAGLKVPDDLSLIGFDDIPFSAITHPPLTTVHQDFFEIGRQAAKLLMDIMKDYHFENHVVVDHELIERESVKDLNES